MFARFVSLFLESHVLVNFKIQKFRVKYEIITLLCKDIEIYFEKILKGGNDPKKNTCFIIQTCQ